MVDWKLIINDQNLSQISTKFVTEVCREVGVRYAIIRPLLLFKIALHKKQNHKLLSAKSIFNIFTIEYQQYTQNQSGNIPLAVLTMSLAPQPSALTHRPCSTRQTSPSSSDFHALTS